MKSKDPVIVWAVLGISRYGGETLCPRAASKTSHIMLLEPCLVLSSSSGPKGRPPCSRVKRLDVSRVPFVYLERFLASSEEDKYHDRGHDRDVRLVHGAARHVRRRYEQYRGPRVQTAGAVAVPSADDAAGRGLVVAVQTTIAWVVFLAVDLRVLVRVVG